RSAFFIMTTQSAPDTLFSELKSKIELHQAPVAVIGLGYVGLPLALLYTEQKFPVTGFDIDQRKVSTLAQGGPTSSAFLQQRFRRPAPKALKLPPTTPGSPRWMPLSSVSLRR